jgi:hypothetical protein
MTAYEVTITCGARVTVVWLEASSPKAALRGAVEDDRELREALRKHAARAEVKRVAA